jgi:hypothetical protein
MDREQIDRLLGMAGSERRAEVLVRVLAEVTPEEGNELLGYWFNMCDALAPWAAELRREFLRCGFVTDTEDKLFLPVTVYRGAWEDDDTASALSWTTDLETAQKFCRIMVGPRGWFLGLNRTDSTPTVFRGICVKALGYLNEREEHEVIADQVIEIEAIQQLRPAPDQGAA